MLRPELQRVQYRNCRVDLYQRISRFPFKNTRTKQNETAQHSEQKKKKMQTCKKRMRCFGGNGPGYCAEIRNSSGIEWNGHVACCK